MSNSNWAFAGNYFPGLETVVAEGETGNDTVWNSRWRADPYAVGVDQIVPWYWKTRQVVRTFAGSVTLTFSPSIDNPPPGGPFDPETHTVILNYTDVSLFDPRTSWDQLIPNDLDFDYLHPAGRFFTFPTVDDSQTVSCAWGDETVLITLNDSINGMAAIEGSEGEEYVVNFTAFFSAFTRSDPITGSNVAISTNNVGAGMSYTTSIGFFGRDVQGGVTVSSDGDGHETAFFSLTWSYAVSDTFNTPPNI